MARWISCSQLAAAGRVLLSRQLAAGTAGPELPSRRWPGPERGDGGRVRGGREGEEMRVRGEKRIFLRLRGGWFVIEREERV